MRGRAGVGVAGVVADPTPLTRRCAVPVARSMAAGPAAIENQSRSP